MSIYIVSTTTAGRTMNDTDSTARFTWLSNALTATIRLQILTILTRRLRLSNALGGTIPAIASTVTTLLIERIIVSIIVYPSCHAET